MFIASRCAVKGSRSLSSTTKLAFQNRGRQLPIGAFLDLDNIAPKTHRRSDAKEFVKPIIELARRINYLPGHDAAVGGDANHQILDTKRLLKKMGVNIEGFGNLPTRTWKGKEERDHSPSKQKYMPWTGMDDDGTPGIAQTGLDQDGILRCGVCGAKMKLSKKDKHAGRTLEQKLFAHMKLHSKEQGKRLGKMKQKKKLSSNERVKMKKYQAATVGLNSGKRNELFQVLKEVGVHVRSEDDVDAALIAAADRWMGEVVNKTSDNDIQGVMVVSSNDSDFAPLLCRARVRGFVTVLLTDIPRPVQKLVLSSDIVVGPVKDWNGLVVTSSSLLDDNYDYESGSDESDESTSDGSSFEIRTICSAPTGQILSSVSPSQRDTIRAIPVTDRGLEFMEDHVVSADGDGGSGGSSSVCWELDIRVGSRADKHGAVGKASDVTTQQTKQRTEDKSLEQQLLATRLEKARVNTNRDVSSPSKQLKLQHIPIVVGKSSPDTARIEEFTVKLGKKINMKLLTKARKRRLRRCLGFTAETINQNLNRKKKRDSIGLV